MKKIVSLFSILLLSTVIVFGQSRVVTGKVTDNKGEPVAGASVILKGSTTGVSADADGNFKINALAGSILVFSANQFGVKEVKLGNETYLTVLMLREATNIDEVVVTSLGIQRQRKDLGYSTAKVNNGDLTQAKPVNIATGLTGKVSGLNITTVNNGVFADVKINLRGIRSLTGNNNPTLILDGVLTSIGYLNSLNPNDVLDVTVLKGASATGVYGPDALNGAIIVTTRKGTRDGKPVITVSHTTQLETVAFLPKFQTKFGSGSAVDAFGNGVYDPIENQQYGPAFNGQLVDIGVTLEDGSIQKVPYTALPNEKKKFWNTGVTNQTDVSFSAKDFSMSFQDVTIDGVMPKDQNRRSSFRLNTAKEYNKFRASFNLQYTQGNYNIVNQGASEWGAIQWLVYNTPMHIPLTQYKDWRNNKFAAFDGYFNEYYPNPYWVIDNYRAKGRSHDVITQVELNFKPIKGLDITYRLAGNFNFNENKNTVAGQSVSAYTKAHRDNTLYKDRNSSVSDGESSGSRISSELLLTYSKKFGDFKFDILGGQYFRQTESKSVSLSGSNLVVPTLFNVSNRTGEPGVSEGNSKYRTVAVYARMGLSYQGWANLELTARKDWTSLLAQGKNSYFYPNANVSIVLSDVIDAIKNSNTVSYLKLRGSVGKTGNVNIEPYQLESTYSQGGGFPYGSLPGFTANNIAFNPLLTPEFIENTEVGMEIGLFKNKVILEVAAYKQNNNDQVISVQTSSATGFTSTVTNAASFENKGLEIDLKIRQLFKFRKGNVEFNTNFTINDSKINSIYEGLNELAIGGFTNATNSIIVGQPAYVFKATDYNRDPQGRVIVDAVTGYPSQNPILQQFGRTMPKYIWGITPTINWNNLTLNIVADYRAGHYAYHGIGPDMDFSGISERSARNDRQRFVFPNSVYWDGAKYVPNTNITVANGGYNFYSQNAPNRSIATNYLTTADSWRIREVSLAYQIPTKIFGKQNLIKRATISAIARNLFIWLPKSNEYTDPDFNFSTGNTSGVNSSSITPPSRIFGATLSLTF